MIAELIGAVASDDQGTAWLDAAKALGAGGAGTFALLCWQALRAERGHRRNDARQRVDRQRELDARLEHHGELLARIDERTRNLLGDPADPAVARRRARTPVQGVRVPGARKPTEGGSDP